MKISKLLINISLTLYTSLAIISCNQNEKKDLWPSIEPLPLNPAIEARINEILPKLTLEQKVGQVIQADSDHVTPKEVKEYRLGSG